MCNCGRKKTEVVTSANLAATQAQDAAAAAEEMKILAMQTATQAEQYLRSAANAASNARS